MNPTGLARVTQYDTVSNQRIIFIADLKNQGAREQTIAQALATKEAAKMYVLGWGLEVGHLPGIITTRKFY